MRSPRTSPERRSAPAAPRVSRRAEGDAGPILVGHAAVFDQWTVLYESPTYLWREVIRPGAFASALREGQDVACLWNHETEHLLGRTASGTCRLAEDATGLAVECDLPDTSLGRDLAILMARGDVSKMSFAFIPRAKGEKITIVDEGERIVEERELLDLDLYDVSPVTSPAYLGTDCSLRDEGARKDAEARDRRALAHRRRAMALRLMPIDS